MFKSLNIDELQQREDDIFIKLMDRKWGLEAAGVPWTDDKLCCLWKWQLEEIETAKSALPAPATYQSDN